MAEQSSPSFLHGHTLIPEEQLTWWSRFSEHVLIILTPSEKWVFLVYWPLEDISNQLPRSEPDLVHASLIVKVKVRASDACSYRPAADMPTSKCLRNRCLHPVNIQIKQVLANLNSYSAYRWSINNTRILLNWHQSLNMRTKIDYLIWHSWRFIHNL